ncbi:MAG: NAD(P)H-dependent oxidoreductase subunit E [Desulfitobacteriia bacterium]|jgi:NADH:ubiquinone oxidoreductase subunit E
MATILKQKTCCCTEITEQQKYEKLGEIIEEYKHVEGGLIQILHLAQGLFGYLPLELQEFIAEGLDKPLSEVSGVVTFYSYFSTQPRGKHVIKVCLGTACYIRGGQKVINRLQEILNTEIGKTTDDGLFTLEIARCIGACGLAPAMMIDDTVYKQVNPDKLESILAKYKD